ncbi:T-cell ecto-ADP-ribosyltransferase 2-like isoform X2 [Salmo salar]|uniref:NAD(P)(+)--arginine ADP-ribosyltransferase n=1 Tax=Salmo salar TaxID=8030 RepID=A0A1S3QEV5_SALSA|nr:T-cell ecto-ADP-ribosyltransferase 2-like isoform X2 [Salmo salar]|eukprot:XP_014038372.1 PREDICTED: T-cell ecto-ADP-ribosyltransferase 2-like isoform X1 [Salmo salar]
MRTKYFILIGLAGFVIALMLFVFFGHGQKPFPLDMAPTSIDDQYVSCSNNMHNEVNTVYLPREKNTNSDFNNAWNEARENAKPSIHGLQKVHSMAIYVYTNAEPEIYPDFNRQVRDGRSNYGTTSFQYHSLHFYLTEAIQMLKRNQTTCKTTYRRTKVYFDKDVVNKKVRFGTFTSSTLGREIGRDSFGETSCFEITTCFGADISYYSVFTGEREVLIPPYEVFTVTNIQTKSPENNLWCEVIYTLVSAGDQSDLKCKLQNGAKSNMRSSFSAFNRTSGKGYITLYIMLIITVYH